MGTIIVADAVTTSFDSYTLQDTHAIAGTVMGGTANGTESETFSDPSPDINTLYANGTNSTTGGDSYTFVDIDTSSDQYALQKVVYNQYSISLIESTGATDTMWGFARNNSTTSTYTYTTAASEGSIQSASGATTVGGVTTRFSYSDSSGTNNVDLISGAPATTTTETATTSSTMTGSNPNLNVSETTTAGHADTAAALEVGGYTNQGYGQGGAINDGTNPPSLDTGEGLDSAIGGQDLHALAFTGAELMPTQTATELC